MKNMKRVSALALALVMLFSLAGTGFAASTGDVTLTPNKIEIGTNFSGGEVKVSGSVPEGSQVIVQALSPSKHVALSKKGKVSGVWMTVEQSQVTGMPAMYKVFTSGTMSDIPASVQQELGIDSDFTAVRNLAEVTTKHEEQTVALDKEQAGVFVDGLISLYREQNLYTVNENAVTINGSSFEATVDIPADIPRGETQIMVYAVGADGTIVSTASAPLTVEAVGLVKSLGEMAANNAFAYGLICVGFALVAGIAISQFFKWIQKVVFKEEHVEVGH